MKTNHRITVLAAMLATSLSVVIPLANVASNIKFAQISDTHLVPTMKDDGGSRLKFASDRILRDVVSQINKTGNIDFVVVNGDNVDKQDILTISKLRNNLTDLDCPSYVVIGNHDITGNDGLMPKAKYVEELQGYGFNGLRSYYSVDPNADVHCVFLDTILASTWGGFVDLDELAWLKADLEKNKGKFTMVFMHHNMAQMGFEDNEPYLPSNLADLKAILQSYPNVKMVFSGHHHAFDIREENGIKYIADSAIIEYPNAYRVIDVDVKDDNTITVSLDWKQITDKQLVELSKSRMTESIAMERLGDIDERVRKLSFTRTVIK